MSLLCRITVGQNIGNRRQICVPLHQISGCFLPIYIYIYIYIYTVKPAFAATSIWRPPVHGGHPEVPPMHFTIYFTSIWQPPAQRGQRPHFCAKKAKMNLLSRPQLFFSARYKERNVGNCKKKKRKMFVLL